MVKFIAITTTLFGWKSITTDKMLFHGKRDMQGAFKRKNSPQTSWDNSHSLLMISVIILSSRFWKLRMPYGTLLFLCNSISLISKTKIKLIWNTSNKTQITPWFDILSHKKKEETAKSNKKKPVGFACTKIDIYNSNGFAHFVP